MSKIKGWSKHEGKGSDEPEVVYTNEKLDLEIAIMPNQLVSFYFDDEVFSEAGSQYEWYVTFANNTTGYTFSKGFHNLEEAQKYATQLQLKYSKYYEKN